ncbi:recombinase family protein [uncultured Clostridium sp.]|uniref:recombinase family protein n=1 Tax=uncultured Clostridium sp. TaxID=59620 RepID=UPI002632407C|nr:recombinase family protein [uncultured Clostridium sp.]
MDKKKIAIYCRVSTIEQAEEGYSIDEQKRLLVEWAEKNECEVYETYSDRGISGKDIVHRPAMQELLNDAKEGKFEMVIAWKINRISRKLADVLKIIDTFDQNNITFKSYSEPFETNTPAGRMQFQMMASIGEFERGTIAQNVKMGMMARAREGRWCGNRVLGYDIVPISGTEHKKRRETELVINEDEAKCVQLIFNEYAKGFGYKAITNKINKLGCKTKKGNPFSVGSIRDILTNPVYIGKVRYNVRREWSEKRRKNINPNPLIVEGKHKGIIEIELWDKVQIILKSKQGKPKRIYDGKYPLTGILKCPVCGAGMVISRTTRTLVDGTKHRIAYYSCGAWKNKGTAVCGSNSIRVDEANEYVFGKIQDLVMNEKMVEKIVGSINKKRNKEVKPAKKEINELKNRIDELTKKKKKILEAYEEEILNKKEFVERKEELSLQSEKLESRLEELKDIAYAKELEEVDSTLIKNALSKFGKILTECKDREKEKMLLHLIVSSITMDKSRKVETINIRINEEVLKCIYASKEVSKKDTSFCFDLNLNIVI